ncbi:hypothetical protein JOM56_008280, partial [Amanita muscaria]
MSFIRRAATKSDLLASPRHKSSMTKLTKSGEATPQTPLSSRHVMTRTRGHNTLPSVTIYVAWSPRPLKSLDYFTISFACWAGIQVIRSQELDGFANKYKVWNAAHNLAYKEYIKRNPEVAVLPDSPDANDPELLSDILSAVSLSGSTTTREPGPHLIDKTVRYRDQETGKIMELTIQDCGTSHLKGEWFEVEYDDLTVLQITAGELEEILANRVD